MSGYAVWLSNAKGLKKTPLNDVLGLSFVKSMNNLGSFIVDIPVDYLSIIEADDLVEIWRDGYLLFVGFVRKIAVSDYLGSGSKVTISGPDTNHILQRRVVAYASGESESSKTDYIDDMMKDIVRENLGSSATDSDRDISSLNFSIDGDTSSVPSITKSFAWRNVLSVLQSLARTAAQNGYNLFFGIRSSFSSDKFPVVFSFGTSLDYWNSDRSITSVSPVVFSFANGGILQATTTTDYSDEATVIYAGGQGEGSDRYVKELEETSRSGRSIWNRVEIFADARSESTDAGVDEVASDKLRLHRPRTVFEADLAETFSYKLGSDWNFGDLIGVEHRNRIFNALITSLRVDLNYSGDERISVRVMDLE